MWSMPMIAEFARFLLITMIFQLLIYEAPAKKKAQNQSLTKNEIENSISIVIRILRR